MNNISAKVICASINLTELVTFELEYPRIIHSEFMTHRALSKNSASSRAIPIKKMHQHIREFPQYPAAWGKNNPGMQARENLSEEDQIIAKEIWDEAREAAIGYSQQLDTINAHKQIANRVTEPYMQMKVVCSGTEWKNFFWLRDHKDADPTIRELAVKMQEAYDNADFKPLVCGEWHLPYIDREIVDGELQYSLPETGEILTLEDAKQISASCCAQVSYRLLDNSIAKAKKIYNQLINSQPVHASPVEHQGTPIDYNNVLPGNSSTWPEGVTHLCRDGSLWSGNFNSWIQHRQLIPHHSVKG